MIILVQIHHKNQPIICSTVAYQTVHPTQLF